MPEAKQRFHVGLGLWATFFTHWTYAHVSCESCIAYHSRSSENLFWFPDMTIFLQASRGFRRAAQVENCRFKIRREQAGVCNIRNIGPLRTAGGRQGCYPGGESNWEMGFDLVFSIIPAEPGTVARNSRDRCHINGRPDVHKTQTSYIIKS